METVEQRAGRVAWALKMTHNTRLAPDAAERQLLDQYVRGVLTLDEVMARLEQPSAPQGFSPVASGL